MSTEKRTVAFLILAMASMLGMQLLMDRLGFLPKPRPPAAQAQAEKPATPDAVADKEGAKGEEAAKGEEEPAVVAAKGAKPEGETKPEGEAKPAAETAAAEPTVKLYEPGQLVLGSVEPKNPGDYRIGLEIDQKGAGVLWLGSAVYDAERRENQPGRGKPERQPLRLIQPDFGASPSFALSLVPPAEADADTRAAARLDREVWEVVTGDDGRPVRPLRDKDGKDIGQQVVLRTEVGTPPIVVTKTYTLRRGADGFELEIGVQNDGPTRKVAYNLDGPHGIPIEGDWYTGTFRDVFVHQVGGSKPSTETALDISKKYRKYREAVDAADEGGDVKLSDYLELYQAQPLAYAGVENQYFTVFFEPDPIPAADGKRWDKQTVPTLIDEHPTDPQKSDVSVVMTTREFEVGPNAPLAHRYKVFAGPKRAELLAAYNADGLASYRKGYKIPIIGDAGQLIAPRIAWLLERIYGVTADVARLFGGTRGNYGVAIILLVITVRLCLFPLSRKQALMAKKMQDLQPQMAELKEQYKDDKERYTREVFALQRRNGVNMFAGCLPALIQIPIFIGLWQALNNSVALRHAPFVLWIQDLSAPDMLFKFPFPIPLVGGFLGPYFNVLPLISAGLMLVHTKLFAPPPTTPEAEMQQKMMKYMMVFMAVMLYRVPSGLGIYFITSSSWAICERLLLPKTLKKSKPLSLDDLPPEGDGQGGSNGKGGPDGRPSKPPGLLERLMERLEEIKDEAGKDSTIRNKADRPRDREPERPAQNRPRPKSKPGKRR